MVVTASRGANSPQLVFWAALKAASTSSVICSIVNSLYQTLPWVFFSIPEEPPSLPYREEVHETANGGVWRH